MKRRPPPIPNLSERPRQKRGLSEEERALWETVAQQFKPLGKKPRPAKNEPPSGADAGAAIRAVPRMATPIRTKSEPIPRPPPLAPLGRRERARLSRGSTEIDARIDLHGMTQSRAHRVLLGFLQRAQNDGLSFVLVITGKGRLGGDSARGVLRRQVPQWLSLPEFRSLVVGFEEAHIGHGGAGALYVRMRRARF